MAFVFLNRFLDIDEAIDDTEGASTVENVGFETSDIPHDFIIPEKHFLEGNIILQGMNGEALFASNPRGETWQQLYPLGC